MSYLKIIGLAVALHLNMLSANKLYVVTTSTDLASIAQEIGGDHINAESLTRGNTDLHYVMAQPDFILKLNKANVFIEIGLDLEAGWTPYLLRQARNDNIQRGRKGYCQTSKGIKLLEVPVGEVNRSMGDLHIYGNPHYWADPLNGIIMAKNIRDTLVANDPTNATSYKKNYHTFTAKIKAMIAKTMVQMKPHKGKKVYSYHQDFSYLARRFGLVVAGTIEEKPGLTPGPAGINKAVEEIKKGNIRVILCSPWTNTAVARQVAQKSGAKLIIMPIQTGSESGSDTWLKMIESNIRLLAENL